MKRREVNWLGNMNWIKAKKVNGNICITIDVYDIGKVIALLSTEGQIHFHVDLKTLEVWESDE